MKYLRRHRPIHQMASNIKSVSLNASAASEAASRAKNASEEGGHAVSEVISGMASMRKNVQGLARKIKKLGERSVEISTILNAIGEISEQTDILALNAAIESARAGEHGRGFSVVAEEIRKLAEKSSRATKVVDNLISGIQAETNEVVSAMETQTQEVEKQSAAFSSASSSLERIREASMQSAELIIEIDQAARQQVKGANSIVDAMEKVSSIAKQAQQGASQTRKSTDELNTLAGELTESVELFKVN